MRTGRHSPFSVIPDTDWVVANDLCFAVFDSFPESPGHMLVITRRIVLTFFDCTAAEQAALMALVNSVKRFPDERHVPKPDGYNVGFNAGSVAGQTVPHVHVHVIPRQIIGKLHAAISAAAGGVRPAVGVGRRHVCPQFDTGGVSHNDIRSR